MCLEMAGPKVLTLLLEKHFRCESETHSLWAHPPRLPPSPFSCWTEGLLGEAFLSLLPSASPVQCYWIQ